MLFRTTLIAGAIVALVAPVNAQQSSPQRGVRIITPYSEHIYEGPRQLPDDEALRQQNVEGWRQFQMDMARRRQEEMDATRRNWRLRLARSSPARLRWRDWSSGGARPETVATRAHSVTRAPSLAGVPRQHP
jgi:hypothetical protein